MPRGQQSEIRSPIRHEKTPHPLRCHGQPRFRVRQWPSSPPSGGNQGSPDRASRDDPPELSFYNDGVKLLFKKEWAAAEKQFTAAVAINPKMPEAHNNLAYVLRKQGEPNFAKSLEHYNRAIELKPKMPEAYMHRGALHYFMGHPELPNPTSRRCSS